MTRRSARPSLSFACALMIASLLAACGGGDAEDSDSPSSTAASEVGAPSRHALSVRQAGATVQAELLPLTYNQLVEFNKDWLRNHEAIPQGVPTSYDWARKGRIGAGNTVPAGYSAITGWGQSFWVKGTTAPSTSLEIRNHQVLLCTGPEATWTLEQSGSIAGSMFYADYSSNASLPPLSFTQANGVADVRYAPSMAYHFWPNMGRVPLPTTNLCGILVLLEARGLRDPGSPPPANGVSDLLIGLGADYWTTTTATWNNYATNTDVGIGRLRLVTSQWQWFGMSTASNADLKKLATSGYLVPQP